MIKFNFYRSLFMSVAIALTTCSVGTTQPCDQNFTGNNQSFSKETGKLHVLSPYDVQILEFGERESPVCETGCVNSNSCSPWQPIEEDLLQNLPVILKKWVQSLQLPPYF